MSPFQRFFTPDEMRDALRRGVLAGVAALAVLLPPSTVLDDMDEPVGPLADAGSQADSPSPSAAPRGSRAASQDRKARLRKEARLLAQRPRTPPLRLASFGDEPASEAVRHVAHWAVHTRDHQRKALVIVDKREAKVYVLDPEGVLVAATPALLGAASGDHSVPGIGEKPLSEVLPDEKTTPAGRFVAEPGVNLKGEDIVWVDYDVAVSMHRVRPLVKAERRLERLASPTPEDNRISFGCINLPVAFYEDVLSPTVQRWGAIIYVLPEVKTPQQVFRSWDVLPPLQPVQLAQR